MYFPFGETVLFLPFLPGQVNAHGNPGEAWADDIAGVPIAGCAFDPGSSSESVSEGNRNTVTTTPTLYCQPGAPFTSKGRVRVRGELYEVDGNPADYRSPFTGWNPGVVVNLRQVTG